MGAKDAQSLSQWNLYIFFGEGGQLEGKQKKLDKKSNKIFFW
jgi:hypothetical protein